MDAPFVIGLCGRKRAGKDFTARIVFPEFTRRAFADPLRDEVARRFGNDVLPSGRTLNLALDEVGWEGLKADPEDLHVVRQLLQNTGQAKREDEPNYWLDLIINDQMPRLCIVTDVRFPNEMNAVRSRGGMIIHVVNYSLPEDEDLHISEWAWRGLIREDDPELVNPGTESGLLEQGNRLREILGLSPLALA